MYTNFSWNELVFQCMLGIFGLEKHALAFFQVMGFELAHFNDLGIVEWRSLAPGRWWRRSAWSPCLPFGQKMARSIHVRADVGASGDLREITWHRPCDLQRLPRWNGASPGQCTMPSRKGMETSINSLVTSHRHYVL